MAKDKPSQNQPTTKETVKDALFKEADYLPFMLGVFIIGGLLVIPILWGVVGLELSYPAAIPWSLASCATFLIAFRRNGSICWSRAIPALIGLMIIAQTHSAITGEPAFGAGGILGFFVIVICGYLGIGIAKLIRHKNRMVGIGTILVIPFLVFLFWSLFGKNLKLKSRPISSPRKSSPSPTIEEKVDSSLWQTYKNNSYSFSFRYPEDKYQLSTDNEVDYSQEGNLDTNIRDNFTKLKGYEPPAFLFGLKLIDKNQRNYLQIWLFDNPDQKGIAEWYDQYDYYPFNWGVSVYEPPEQERPTQDFPIKDALGKQVTLPETSGGGHYVYILKGNWTYLIYLRETSVEGSRILEGLTIK